MNNKVNNSSGAVTITHRRERYVASAVDEYAARWLNLYAASQTHRAHGRSVEVDPRFINEFCDAAKAAKINIINKP